MHRPTMLPAQDRRPRVEDARKQAATCSDFGGVEHAGGRSLGAESVRRVGDQENQTERRKHQAPTRSEALRQDNRGDCHGRRQARADATIREEVASFKVFDNFPFAPKGFYKSLNLRTGVRLDGCHSLFRLLRQSERKEAQDSNQVAHYQKKETILRYSKSEHNTYSDY